MLVPVVSLPFYPVIKEQTAWWGDFPLGHLLDQAGLEVFIDQILQTVLLTLFLSHWLQFLTGTAPSRTTLSFWTKRDLGVIAYCPLFLLLPLLFFLNSLWEQLESIWGESNLLLALMHFTGSGAIWLVYLGVFAPFLLALAVSLLLLGRCGPVFAAAATGNRLRLFAAWRLTRGLTLRLLWLWLLLFAGPGVVGGLLLSPIEASYNASLEAGFDPSFGLIPPDNIIAWQAVWQVVQLPRTTCVFVAAALIASVCLRAYRGEAPTLPNAQQHILDRFE